MSSKIKKTILFQRLFIWALYLFSGFILYSKKSYLISNLIIFAKVIYPLSIFWLQIRIKRRVKFLPIDDSMSTSQLWFNILPVLSCFVSVIITILNASLYISDKLIS